MSSSSFSLPTAAITVQILPMYSSPLRVALFRAKTATPSLPHPGTLASIPQKNVSPQRNEWSCVRRAWMANPDSGDGFQLASYPLIWIDHEALAWNVEQAARMEPFSDLRKSSRNSRFPRKASRTGAWTGGQSAIRVKK